MEGLETQQHSKRQQPERGHRARHSGAIFVGQDRSPQDIEQRAINVVVLRITK
jgi:hypothetical protein